MAEIMIKTVQMVATVMQVYISPILWKDYIMALSTTRPAENQGPGRNASSQNKKELQAFLGIINYLAIFSPSTAGVCDPL